MGTHWNTEVNRTCPLRTVVDSYEAPTNPSMVVEVLDCGHATARYKVRKATDRRRCIYCGGLGDWEKDKEVLCPGR